MLKSTFVFRAAAEATKFCPLAQLLLRLRWRGRLYLLQSHIAGCAQLLALV
jgi:hypothetical protein